MKIKYWWLNTLLISLISLSLAQCQSKKYYNPIDYTVELDSTKFSSPSPQGKLKSDKLDELSGLAASRYYPNMFWTHNDSGGKDRLYLINHKAKLQGEMELKGAKNRDWEDICIAYDSSSNTSYIYLAEMGDNKASYPDRFIYRIAEPRLELGRKEFDIKSQVLEKIAFEYPDGVRDAETLMYDSQGKDLYIVSKREDSVRVYQMPNPYSTKEVNTLIHIATLGFHNANGGDISPDGNEILIRNYSNIYYWKRQAGESIAQTLQSVPVRLPYKEEPQGESVAWKADQSGYYTISEAPDKVEVQMLFYKREGKKKAEGAYLKN